jgi:Flp pilus assembly protein TadG
MLKNSTPTSARGLLRRLLRGDGNKSGVAMIEFAYSLPIFMTLGLTGTELSNLAVTNMQVSQIAMSITDNLSRAKQTVALGLPQFREHDVNDAFLGAGLQAGNLNLFQNGRVIVTSLQQDKATGNQWLAWQRCRGLKTSVSAYGVEGTGATGGLTGVGPSSSRISAEPDTAIVVTEVVYTYKPLVAASLLGPITIKQESAFYVRDDRDLTKVYNPTPAATVRSCNLYTS